MNIVKTSAIVQDVLEKYPHTRNSDDYLYILVCHKINSEAVRRPFSYVMTHRKDYGYPSFESVSRSRRKLQELHAELASSIDVETQRKANEENIKAYAREWR